MLPEPGVRLLVDVKELRGPPDHLLAGVAEDGDRRLVDHQDGSRIPFHHEGRVLQGFESALEERLFTPDLLLRLSFGGDIHRELQHMPDRSVGIPERCHPHQEGPPAEGSFTGLWFTGLEDGAECPIDLRGNFQVQDVMDGSPHQHLVGEPDCCELLPRTVDIAKIPIDDVHDTPGEVIDDGAETLFGFSGVLLLSPFDR